VSTPNIFGQEVRGGSTVILQNWRRIIYRVPLSDIVLAFGTECWYFILREVCMCDVVLVYYCRVELLKHNKSVFNRNWWTVHACNPTHATVQWKQSWLHQTDWHLGVVLPDSGWLLQSLSAGGDVWIIVSKWAKLPMSLSSMPWRCIGGIDVKTHTF
jgi:hypothetical protein